MTAARRLREEGRQEGRLKGRQEGRQEAREEGLQRSRLLLLRAVQQRFGVTLEPTVEQRLRGATLEQVEVWLLRALTVSSLAELFAD